MRNWNAACEFYGDTLGLTERSRNDEIGWAEYEVAGPCIGVERVSEGDEEGTALVGRFLGISLHVDDIESMYSSLSEAGVSFLGPPETHSWGGTLAHFADPDGNVLTLLG